MPQTTPPPPNTAELDAALHTFGFVIDSVSAEEITGHLKVTETCCQQSSSGDRALHGGILGLISESLGSMGAHLASGFRRVAGIQLSIHHHASAAFGDHVFARAFPLHVGKTIQVWDICMWKMDPSTSEKGALLASSRVTLLSNMPVPERAKDAEDALKKYARL